MSHNFKNNKEEENLYPITLTRPACHILCGGVTLDGVIKEVFSKTKSNIEFDSTLVPSFQYALEYAKELKKNKNAVPNWPKFEKLSDVISYNEKILGENLKHLTKNKKQIKKGVYVGKNFKMEPNVFFDTSAGLIVIEEGTKIKANVVLRGPLYIGKNCVVNSFAEVSGSSIGDVCKIGGEVSESIIQGYSNKQHYGFLGHAYVGSWVNIGGGTSNSNMKNTYGKVFMNGIDSGSIFMGTVIGDYSKTAVNSSIFTGKVIGVSSHLYGTVIEDVPSFVSHVGVGNLYELPLEVAEKIQRAMAERRGFKFTDIDHKHFENLFNQTSPQRKQAKVKIEKLSFK